MEPQIREVSIGLEDVHCGQIYLHEPSMMLKFYCIFCQKTFDDINYYCNHLTNHVDAVSIIKQEDFTEYDNKLHGTQEHYPNNFIAMEESLTSESEHIPPNDNQYIEEVGNIETVLEQESVLNTENSWYEDFYGCNEEDIDQDEEESRQFLFESNHIECDDEGVSNSKSVIMINNPNFELEKNSINSNNREEDFDNSYTEYHVNSQPIKEEFVKEIKILKGEVETYNNKESSKQLDAVHMYGNEPSAYGDPTNMVEDEVTVKMEEYPAQISEEPMDFENLIENAKIVKPSQLDSTVLVPSPVIVAPAASAKTFKIITPKNKIDKLYTTVNEVSKEGHKLQEMRRKSPKKGIERTPKIIGSTVITSLPVEINVERAPTEDSDEYKCSACNKVFRNQQSLSLHARVHYIESHSEIKVAHRCSECNGLFNYLKDLQLHVQKAHYPDGFKCRLCHNVLRKVSLLEVHMRKMHLQHTTLDLRCKYCGRTNFESKESFEEHRKIHGKEEKFRCYICNKQYTMGSYLKQHILRHSLGRGDRCVVCGKVTQRLAQHMKIHSPRPTRLLQCSICNKTFSFSSALSRHNKVMHKLPRTIRTKTLRNENTNATKRRRKVSKHHGDNNAQITNATVTDFKVETAEDDNDDIDDDKKVVVEIIENVMNRKTLMEDDIFENMDCTVARYETIAAVNSITPSTEYT